MSQPYSRVRGILKNAQDYAFAQDVYLLSLREIPSVRPAIEALEALTLEDRDNKPKLSAVRKYVRSRLRGAEGYIDDELIEALEPFIETALNSGVGLVIMIGQQFPVFLVAKDEFVLHTLGQAKKISIRKYGRQWYMADVNGERLFSFDVPSVLYRKYRDQDGFRRRAKANINSDVFKKVYVFYEYEGNHRLATLELDEDWI